MTKRKDGLWQQALTVEINGRKVVKTFYGKTKQAVLDKVAQLQHESKKGALFEDVAEEWWESHQKTLSPTTVPGYLRDKNRAVSYFKNTYIRLIRPLDIQRFVAFCVDEWHMAKNTAANLKIVINQIMVHAVANGYIDFNPARDIPIPKGLKKTPRKMPSDQDIEKIKASTACTFGMFAYFALYTGLRKGEILALTWDDIDLDNRVIHVNKAVYDDHGTPKIKRPKTENGVRSVPILDRLYDKLIPGKGILFSDEGRYISAWKFQKYWSSYCAESGITCTVHQLRHAFTTMLFECDISVKDAQKILGHAQASTTQDIYTDIRKAHEMLINKKLLSADI